LWRGCSLRLRVREFLERDRDLLNDELWRLFQCEGSGELSLAAYDKYVQEQNSWLEAFRSMAIDGTIDRARVLASTLDALTRDFAPFRAGWYSRLHEALKPTRAERVEYRERYLDLFPNEQLLVLDSDVLAAETQSTVNRVLTFLGLAPFPAVEPEWPREHVGEYGDDSADVLPVLERLREFYAPHNERLRILLDQPPAWLLA